MTSKLLSAICLMAAIALGFSLGRQHTRSSQPSGMGTHRVLYYVDPMHPTYKSDRPGIAPDCGMPLEPVYADQIAQYATANPPTVAGSVNIASDKQQLLGIRVATVQRSSGTRKLRILGRVVADETRVYRVNLGVDGFVKETHEDVVGNHVRKDQQLAIVYSPEFLSVVGGFLSASERAQGGNIKEGGAGTQGLASIQNWADRLRNLGMSEVQVNEVRLSRKIPDDIYVLSPADGFILSRNISPGQRFERRTEFYRIADLSHVWIVAELFGREAHQFLAGALARITLPDQKRNLWARVSRVLPQVDPSTRGVQLRLEADNPSLALRPDMFVDVDLPLAVPPGLSVPADAVLDLGLSQRVFVERGEGWFEPREVETGERFADRVQIVRGLAEGERVVAAGTFMVDSESRLKTAAPMLGDAERNRREPGDLTVKQSSVTADDATREIDPTRPKTQKTTSRLTDRIH